MATKTPPTGYPEFGVRWETIGSFFSPPLASSTFYDLVNKGKIVPMKGLRGFYCLNDSLRRLRLPQPGHCSSAYTQQSRYAVVAILAKFGDQLRRPFDLLIFRNSQFKALPSHNHHSHP